jgi:hypothetical protein
MPLPLILAGAAAVTGVGGIISGIRGGAKIKEAKETMNSARRNHEQNVARFEKQQGETTAVMDALGKKEIEILGSFEKFSQLIEKIQNKPTFKTYDKNGVSIPKYNTEELKQVSVGAGVLLGGLGGAAAGTAGGFAAAGATTAAVMALGTASTGTAIATLSGVAATNATLAAIGGGAVAAGGGGIALGTTILGATTFGVALLVGGVIFNIVGSSLSDKADEAWRQMKRAEGEINKICKYLEKLGNAAKRYHEALVIVDKIYADHLNKLASIIETDKKTDWNAFSDEEKLVTENTVLLVGLLFSMCKVQIVLSSGNDTETNRINLLDINRSILNADAVLGESDLGKDALAGHVSKAIQIASLETLSKIGRDDAYPLNGYYELTCDIDASGSRKGFGFEPIGPFNGMFDGNDFKIKGLFINRGQNDNVGLFGCIGKDAEINGVYVAADIITGKNCVGGLAGVSHGRVTNCGVSGMLSGREQVGGLVGSNSGSIIDSYSTGEVSGEKTVGGLAGISDGTVSQCYCAGKVDGGGVLGGLVGESSGEITECYFLGEVQGKNTESNAGGAVSPGAAAFGATLGMIGLVGGIMSGLGKDRGDTDAVRAVVGYASSGTGGLVGSNVSKLSKTGTVTKCCSMGKVSGEGDVGGLVGNNSGDITLCYSTGEVIGNKTVGGLVGVSSSAISKCYSTGEVHGKESVGGFVGKNDGGADKITDCYWDVATSDTTDSQGGKGKVTSKMQSRALYENWDFEKVWEIDEGKDYPRLRALETKS